MRIERNTQLVNISRHDNMYTLVYEHCIHTCITMLTLCNLARGAEYRRHRSADVRILDKRGVRRSAIIIRDVDRIVIYDNSYDFTDTDAYSLYGKVIADYFDNDALWYSTEPIKIDTSYYGVPRFPEVLGVTNAHIEALTGAGISADVFNTQLSVAARAAIKHFMFQIGRSKYCRCVK